MQSSIKPRVFLHYLPNIFGIALILMLTQLSVIGQASKPNIIFIMADDLGYGDLGCYGQKIILTPNIDKLALEGIRFTQCYTGSPVCAPSRSVLMTGLHTGHTTVRGNTGKFGVPGIGGRQGRVPLEAHDTTVAEIIKDAGYVTGCIGKWGLGEPGTSGEPRRQGFDYFFGFLNQRRAHNYYTEFLWENERKYPLLGNEDEGEKIYAHDVFIKKINEFLAAHHDTSFFLYLPFTIPHDKYQIPSTDPYTQEEWSHDEKVHAAMITRMDKDIGQILEQINTYELEAKTMVFFCSDNGAAQRWEGRFDSSGKLRGRKRDLYEGGIRTPMIVKYPGKIDPGTMSDEPWYFADVLPTLAALVNASVPSQLDGINMLPSILGNHQNYQDRLFYWEFHERGFQQAIRQKHWKLINLGLNEGLELYNLAIDPEEKNDLSQSEPAIRDSLLLLLNKARTPSKNWPIDN